MHTPTAAIPGPRSAVAEELPEPRSSRQGEARLRVAACHRYSEAPQLDRHFRRLDHHRDAIDDRSAVNIGLRLVAEQHHRNAPRRHNDVRADVDEAPGLALE